MSIRCSPGRPRFDGPIGVEEKRTLISATGSSDRETEPLVGVGGQDGWSPDGPEKPPFRRTDGGRAVRLAGDRGQAQG